MPRSNRPRSRRGEPEETPELDLTRALIGRANTESKRDGLWNVQTVASAAAAKVYRCPGCVVSISAGTAHVVAWRADGMMGEAEDLAARRHWHAHCWRIKP